MHPPSLAFQERNRRRQGLGSRGGVLYEPPFSNSIGSDFELRLHQRHQVGSFGRQRQGAWQRLGKADEAYVADNKLRRFGDFRDSQIARINPFKGDDPPIASQARMQLAMTDIDGVDRACACGQADLRKAAR